MQYTFSTKSTIKADPQGVAFPPPPPGPGVLAALSHPIPLTYTDSCVCTKCDKSISGGPNGVTGRTRSGSTPRRPREHASALGADRPDPRGEAADGRPPLPLGGR